MIIYTVEGHHSMSGDCSCDYIHKYFLQREDAEACKKQHDEAYDLWKSKDFDYNYQPLFQNYCHVRVVEVH